jgi:hypothetical protein
VASGTALIVGIRTIGSAATDIDVALWQRRSLVKTWGMRGTLHLFPAAELPIWVAAFRQRQWPRFTPGWEKYHGVTADDLRHITDALGQVLPGRVLTREELATEIAPCSVRAGGAEPVRMGSHAQACSGRRSGVPGCRARARMPVRTKRVAFCCCPDSTRAPLHRSAPASTNPRWVRRPGVRTAGWISPVLVVDGVVRGTWTHERAGGRLAIEVARFSRITKRVRTTAEEYAQRYGTLLDAKVVMTWT